MLIAVTVDGNDSDSPVSEDFAACRYLLVVETDTMQFEAIANSGDADDARLAETVVTRNCEAIITGKIPSPAFDILAGEGITRYLGCGLDVKTAVQRMDKNALEYICYLDGTDACSGDHHTCDGDCDSCVSLLGTDHAI